MPQLVQCPRIRDIFADEELPRTPRERSAVLAIGSILDRPRWWRVWTARDGDDAQTRAQWLAEMDAALVRRAFAEALDHETSWPAAMTAQAHAALLAWFESPIAGLPPTAPDSERVACIQRFMADVAFPIAEDIEAMLGFGGPTDQDEDLDEFEDEESDDEDMGENDGVDGEEDSGDELALDEDDQVVPFDEAIAAIRRRFPNVKTDPASENGESEDENEHGEEDRDFESELCKAHAQKDPFAQLAWYVHISSLRASLARCTASELVSILRGAVDVDRELLLSRAALFVSNAMCATDHVAPTMEIVKALTHESCDEVNEILRLHLTRILEFVEMTKQDVCSVLDLVVERLQLEATKEHDVVESGVPGAVPGSWIVDGLLSKDQVSTLLNDISAVEQLSPTETECVVNIVDPSLYCLELGTSKRLPVSEMKNAYSSPEEQMRAIANMVPRTKTKGLKGWRYQWIPAEVEVSDNGSEAKFLSYINNLHPGTFKSTYKTLENILGRLIPLFNQVISSQEDHPRRREAQALYAHSGNKLRCHPGLVPPGLFEVRNPIVSLNGSQCQVVVKIHKITVTPTRPYFAGELWTADGTPAEQIIATGVFVAQCDNITPPRMAFCARVTPTTLQRVSADELRAVYGIKMASPDPTESLGSISILSQRAMVYPGHLKHRMDRFELADRTHSGGCTLVTFYVVHPENSITSSALIPPQQQQWIEQHVEPVTKRIKRMSLDENQPARNEPKGAVREGITVEAALQQLARVRQERRGSAE